MDADLVAKAAILAPDAVLRALAACSAGAHLPERPVVRLRLTSGYLAEGWLIGVGADHAEEIVLLRSPAHRQQVADEMVYLRMRDVVAVGVVDATRFRDVLSGCALPLPVDGEPVSRLALRREFAPSAELPLAVAWDALPDAPQATANLAGLLAALRRAAAEVNQDEAGRQACAAIMIVRVEHRPGDQVLVHRLPGGVVVSADLTAALPRRLDAELSHRLNTVL